MKLIKMQIEKDVMLKYKAIQIFQTLHTKQ